MKSTSPITTMMTAWSSFSKEEKAERALTIKIKAGKTFFLLLVAVLIFGYVNFQTITFYMENIANLGYDASMLMGLGVAALVVVTGIVPWMLLKLLSNLAEEHEKYDE